MKTALFTIRFFVFIFFIASGCKKEVSIENHIATGSLKDISGICLQKIVHGTFYNGITPGDDTAYIELKVNVLTPGTYSVFTDLQNGLRFSGSGVFTNTGINRIRLKPEGTPIANIPTGFTIRYDTSVCPVTINIHDKAEINQNTPPVTEPFYNWKFTDTKRKVTYRGVFEDNYIYLLGPVDVLVLSTKAAQAPGDSTFTINIGLPQGIIKTGTYITTTIPTGIVFKTFSDPCLNCAGGGLIPISIGGVVTIIITSYDPATKTVKGTFSGTTIDVFNEIAAISDGEFSAVVK
ncbi:MAG: hypothetical protein ABI416_05430 [Ginsengibacter sp.]